MFNLIYNLYNTIINFNINNYILNNILIYISVFQFTNCILLILFFIYLILRILNKKYSYTQKVNFFKRILNRAIIGFFLTFLIYLISKNAYCNNSINSFIANKFLDTKLKQDIAIISLLILGSYACYKIGSVWYTETMFQKTLYLKRKETYFNELNSNKILEKNYIDEKIKFEFDSLEYQRLLLKYNDYLLFINSNQKLYNEYLQDIQSYNNKLEINKPVKEIHEEILLNFNNFNTKRILELEDLSNTYKHIYIFNNIIRDINKGTTIIDDHRQNLEVVNRNLLHKEVLNREELIQRGLLNKDLISKDLLKDNLKLYNVVVNNMLTNKNEEIKEDLFLKNEYINLSKQINLVPNNSNELNLITFRDMSNISLIQEAIRLSKNRINNLNDTYISDRIKSTETLLTTINMKNKFSINLSNLNFLKNNILNNIVELDQSYHKLCSSVIELKNFTGMDTQFMILLKNHFNIIKYHNSLWIDFLKNLNQYTLYIKNIPSEVMPIFSEVYLEKLDKPIEPIEPIEPIYNLTFNEVTDIPIVDFSGSYLLGLKFASINFGYSVLYPTFLVLDFFLGVGNPIPKELFVQSIKYFIKFKMFFGK